MVLTPVDNKQLGVAGEFLKKAKENLLVPGNNYEIQGVCQELKFLASPYYSSQSTPESIISSDIFKWIVETSKNKECNGNPEKAINSLISTIDDYLSQHKDKDMIIFAQIPWESTSIKDSAYSSMKDKMSKIKDKNRLKKIYIFGVSQNSKKIVDVFEPFGTNKVDTTGNSLSELDNMINESRKFINQ